MNATAPQALQLRDIHLPAAPAFWPPAPGWWVLAALLLALTVGTAFVGWRRHRRRGWARRVLDNLAALEARVREQRSPEALAEIAQLMRRLALARYPRDRVSPLAGLDWLRFLDESGGDGRFVDGPGRVLATLPYRRALPANLDVEALLALVHDWVRANLRSAA